MWLMTPVGFFSMVRKPTDIENTSLTIRARVRADLERLKASFLPELGLIFESRTNDYRFRAVAPQAAVARAMARLVEDLDYDNFKNAVAQRQGKGRADLYHEVWATLYELQRPDSPNARASQPKNAKPKKRQIHPQRDDGGFEVVIQKPSKASPIKAWLEATKTAAVLPVGAMVTAINGMDFLPWECPPASPEGWETLAQLNPVKEPRFRPPKGLEPAAGVVIQERDGRIWLVCPTNQFAGYEVTFPKGRTDGSGLQATAITEAYEESGLRVRLLRHLIDVKRTQTYTRYYLAERIGGSPADMGWESQCVMLVPPSQLEALDLNESDRLVVRALGA